MFNGFLQIGFFCVSCRKVQRPGESKVSKLRSGSSRVVGGPEVEGRGRDT